MGVTKLTPSMRNLQYLKTRWSALRWFCDTAWAPSAPTTSTDRGPALHKTFLRNFRWQRKQGFLSESTNILQEKRLKIL